MGKHEGDYTEKDVGPSSSSMSSSLPRFIKHEEQPESMSAIADGDTKHTSISSTSWKSKLLRLFRKNQHSKIHHFILFMLSKFLLVLSLKVFFVN
jgi:hypothetical protein